MVKWNFLCNPAMLFFFLLFSPFFPFFFFALHPIFSQLQATTPYGVIPNFPPPSPYSSPLLSFFLFFSPPSPAIFIARAEL